MIENTIAIFLIIFMKAMKADYIYKYSLEGPFHA